jgi:hypothetical protein
MSVSGLNQRRTSDVTGEEVVRKVEQADALADAGGVSLPQHSDQHRPRRPILLAVDQELAADRLGASRRNPVTNSGQRVSVAPPPAASARIPCTICSPADP